MFPRFLAWRGISLLRSDGSATLMCGKSQTCRRSPRVCWSLTRVNHGSETVKGITVGDRQVEDLPRIGVAEPSQR